MEHAILEKLDAVRNRDRRRNLWQGLAWGLLTGAVLACLLAAGKWLIPGLLFPVLAAVSLVVGLGVGASRSKCVKSGRRQAAEAIDRHAHLEDRTLSALDFLESDRLRPIHELHLDETTKRLEPVDPIAVVPGRFSVTLVVAMLAAVVAIGLIVWPIGTNGSMTTNGENPKPTTGPSTEEAVRKKPLESIRDEIGWQAAPVGRIATHRTNLLTDATLQEVVAEPVDGLLLETSGVVLESERLPLDHRSTIRAYFETSK